MKKNNVFPQTLLMLFLGLVPFVTNSQYQVDLAPDHGFWVVESNKERLEKALANDTTKTGIVFENGKMKVTSYDSQPGNDVCGIGKHSHPPHLTILLTDATVKITLPDGKTVVQKAPAGAAFWAGEETHVVINNGDKAIKAYIVEAKEPDAKRD